MKNFNKLVDAVNFLNEYIPQIVTEVKGQLDPFIGKPIKKADGAFRKSINWQYKPIKKQLPNSDWLNVSYNVQQHYNYVDLQITVCLSGGNYDVHPASAFTLYEKASLTIYTVDEHGNIVDFVVDLSQYDARYTVDVLKIQAELVQDLAKQLAIEIAVIPHRFREALYIPRIQ